MSNLSSTEGPVLTFLKEVQALSPADVEVDAVVRRARSSASVARRGPRAARLVAIAATVFAVVACSGAAAVAAGWRPGLIFNPEPRPLARIHAGATAPTDLLSRLRVLRRPPTAEDAGPAAIAAARGIRAPFIVNSRFVRSVGTTPLGEKAFLVAARADARGMPVPEQRLAATAPGNSVFVAVTGPYGGVGQVGPFTARSIEAGSAWLTSGLPVTGPVAQQLRQLPRSLRTGSLFTAVVPDGVARVQLIGPDGIPRTLDVENNVVLGHFSLEADMSAPKHIVWLDGSGHSIQRFDYA